MLSVILLSFIIVLLTNVAETQFNESILPGYEYNDNYQSKSNPLSRATTESIEDIQTFLLEFNIEAAEMCNRVVNSEWKYATNATEYNKRRLKEQQSAAIKFECLSWKKSAHFVNRPISDPNVKRQLHKIFEQGKCGLNDEKYDELNNLINQMKTNYKQAKICPYTGTSHTIQNAGNETERRLTMGYAGDCDLSIENDLQRIMEVSRNADELKYIWTNWYDKVGAPNRNNFMRYVDLANHAAQIHGFDDAGEQMRSIYEDADLKTTVQELWLQIQPLYRHLFTFVRKGLVRKYGEGVVRPDGPIPAHLVGNLWSLSWKNILDIAKYRHSDTPDISAEMVRQGYTSLRIFQKAEEFFTSLGMPPLSPEFWRNSILQQSNNERTKCTASAWDFCNNFDFRVKQCTQITLEDFIGTHHEIAHVQYYMLYANKPFVYREGSNPAFHEAIAHAIGLSAGGLTHLQRIGLLSTSVPIATGNSMINIEYLLSMAMEKIPFIAFSIALEKWRWQVFEMGPSAMNSRWWEQRLRYQGIVPPIPRNADDFDAGAKYQVIADQDYIKYFIGTILQFQIYAELCDAVNHVGPLHTCDIYRNREAGRILSEIMGSGASLPQSQLLKILSRGKTSRLSADALLEFFAPLRNWLEQQNRYDLIGWNSNLDDVALFKSLSSSGAHQYDLSKYFWLFVVIHFWIFIMFNRRMR